MKNFSKKLAALLLALTLMVPGSLAVSAEKEDEPRVPPSSAGTVVSGGTSSTSSKSKKVPYGPVQEKIKAAQAKNSDVKGWLIVPGTNINVATPQGKDNQYYLNRDLNKTNYPNNNYKNYVETASYLDYRTKFGSTWGSSSNNIVIYGHNWSNLRAPYVIGNKQGQDMFAQLASYMDLNFAKEHPYIYFSTGENEGVWKVFSVSLCENYSSFTYNSPNMSTQQMTNLVSEWKQRSLYNFNVDVNGNDRILTLSTCIRHYSGYWDDQRYVVVARLVRPGETDNDPVAVVKNPNVKPPQFVGPPRPRIG